MGSNSNGARMATGLLRPVTGAALFYEEIERRTRLHRKGVLPTGCSEIDDALLVGGGFESGCIVGVSAEEAGFGLLLSLQTVARSLVFEEPDRRGKQRVAIITTLPVTTILPILRDVVRSQAQTKLGPRNPSIDAEVRRCLEAISISRIFDTEGLWEVLRELEAQAGLQSIHDADEDEEILRSHMTAEDKDEVQENQVEDAFQESVDEELGREGASESSPRQTEAGLNDHTPSIPSLQPTMPLPEPITQLPPLRIGPGLQPLFQKREVLDSEDEEPFSSSPLSSPPPSTAEAGSSSPPREQSLPPAEPDAHHSLSSDSEVNPETAPEPTSEIDLNGDPEPSPESLEPEAQPNITTRMTPNPVPDIILVTHFSSLLTTLFAHDDNKTAHVSLQELSSHLRHLARSQDSLVMLLNTTISPSSNDLSTSTSNVPRPPAPNNPTPPPIDPDSSRQPRPLDATLRSIFNPGPQLPDPNTHTEHYQSRLTRRNKPSFGATFAQFLDLHLLCSKLPRTRDDAEMAVALGQQHQQHGLDTEELEGDGVRYAWAVEALLDEMGVWAWGPGGQGGGSGSAVGGGMSRGRDEDEEGDEEGDEIFLPPRVDREQRWAAVDVRDGVRIVNAFATAGAGAGAGRGRGRGRGPIRLAAGFGGPRV
ncbi:hypothetical protein F4808DRAFT_459569 [Astrocystis sublimbata]|nr:hypothetical protein F4808DRAFT_459569 [Astrocystis sublimbata]